MMSQIRYLGRNEVRKGLKATGPAHTEGGEVGEGLKSQLNRLQREVLTSSALCS